jgi:hypothetical protein
VIRVDLRYVAGFFDGEGNVGIYRAGGGCLALKSQVTQNKSQNSTWLLNQLQKRFGGCVTEQRTLSHRTKLNWQLSGIKAARFLNSILPYLVLKRGQAEMAICWQATKKPRTRNGNGQYEGSPPTKVDRDTAAIIRRMKKET